MVNKAHYFIYVAKDIPRSKWQHIDKARDAVEAEWAKLRKQDCWDERNVREYDDVRDRCRRQGKSVHFARLHDICVETGSELDAASRKYKGRVVFGGHNIQNEDGYQVPFNDGGSGASFVTASNFFGCHIATAWQRRPAERCCLCVHASSH